MAKKPARKPTALPAPVEDLITNLTRAGVKSANNDGGAALRQQLSTAPYLLVAANFPCPRFQYTDPDPLVPGAGFDVYFNADWTNLTYSVSVTDLTADYSYGPFSTFVPFGTPNPVAISVPPQAVPFHPPGGALRDIVVADHDYAIHVYATYGGAPYGCISLAFVTMSNDPLKQALFRALTAQGSLPFGNVTAEAQAANAPAKRAAPKKKK